MFRLSNPSSALKNRDNQNNDSRANNNAATCRQQALARSSEKLARHHPTVKVPPRLETKSKQEQIERSIDRFKSHAMAIDTAHRALQTIAANPQVPKYRRIDQTNPGYQRNLGTAPGAEQLLQAVGFVPVSNQTLHLQRVDDNLLQMAIQALENAKQTLAYQHAKLDLVFQKDVAAALQVKPSADEVASRQQLLSTLLKEPNEGRGAIIMIHLTESVRLTRRFHGDDTLQDVLHWLGGTAGTVLLDQILTQNWCLVDVNRTSGTPIDCCPDAARMTLQHLGFWPSGRLQLRRSPTTTSTNDTSTTTTHNGMGASRGLGSTS